MTSPSSKIKSKISRSRFWISPQQREQLTYWLVDHLPHAFDQFFQWLSNNQILLLIGSLVLLLHPLITARPAIWQQALVAALLLVVGRLALQMEGQKPTKKRVSIFTYF